VGTTTTQTTTFNVNCSTGLAYQVGLDKGLNGASTTARKMNNAALPGPLLADGAGSPQVLGTLPLAAGYKATFTNFDLMKQRAKQMQLEVTGQEKVTVPAGTFDAWKLEVVSTDGGNEKLTFWIDVKSRRYVKSTATLPQMGGALMTSELQP